MRTSREWGKTGVRGQISNNNQQKNITTPRVGYPGIAEVNIRIVRDPGKEGKGWEYLPCQVKSCLSSATPTPLERVEEAGRAASTIAEEKKRGLGQGGRPTTERRKSDVRTSSFGKESRILGLLLNLVCLLYGPKKRHKGGIPGAFRERVYRRGGALLWSRGMRDDLVPQQK